MSLADPLADTSVSDEVDGAVPDLPSPDTKRWVVRRKAIVVAAVFFVVATSWSFLVWRRKLREAEREASPHT